jgi:Uma2 family endonuclease
VNSWQSQKLIDFDSARFSAKGAAMQPVVDDKLTIEDFRALPAGPPWYQLVEGELVAAPSLSSYHQDIAGNLYHLLRNHLARHNLGKVFAGPLDVYLSDHDVVQPDVLFVAADRLGIIADDGLHGAPDLAIEVVSPSNAQLDKTVKRRLYARAGVREFWLVDPQLKQVHVYQFAVNPAKPVRIVDEDESFTSPVLPGFEIAASDVFVR